MRFRYPLKILETYKIGELFIYINVDISDVAYQIGKRMRGIYPLFMFSKLYFHDTYWPIRGNKKIVEVCNRHS